RYWFEPSMALSALMVSLSLLTPVTVLIWASCDVICALSMGLSGSWLRNWVTSSLRKRSPMLGPSLAGAAGAAAAVPVRAVVALVAAAVVAMVVIPILL